MDTVKKQYKIWIKVISLTLSCLLVMQSISWAMPGKPASIIKHDNLAVQSIFKPMMDEGVNVSSRLKFEVLAGARLLRAGKTVDAVNGFILETYMEDTDEGSIEFLDNMVITEKGLTARFRVRGQETIVFEVRYERSRVINEKTNDAAQRVERSKGSDLALFMDVFDENDVITIQRADQILGPDSSREGPSGTSQTRHDSVPPGETSDTPDKTAEKTAHVFDEKDISLEVKEAIVAKPESEGKNHILKDLFSSFIIGSAMVVTLSTIIYVGIVSPLPLYAKCLFGIFILSFIPILFGIWKGSSTKGMDKGRRRFLVMTAVLFVTAAAPPFAGKLFASEGTGWNIKGLQRSSRWAPRRTPGDNSVENIKVTDAGQLEVDCLLRDKGGAADIVYDLRYGDIKHANGRYLNSELDMREATVKAEIEIPAEFTKRGLNAVRIVVGGENQGKPYASQYSIWKNINPGDKTVNISFKPSKDGSDASWTDPGFDPSRIKEIKISFSLNSTVEGSDRLLRFKVLSLDIENVKEAPMENMRSAIEPPSPFELKETSIRRTQRVPVKRPSIREFLENSGISEYTDPGVYGHEMLDVQEGFAGKAGRMVEAQYKELARLRKKVAGVDPALRDIKFTDRRFLFCDLYAGFDRSGNLKPIDPGTIKTNIEALVSLARKYKVKLKPVLFDFRLFREHPEIFLEVSRMKEFIQKMRPALRILGRPEYSDVIVSIEPVNEPDVDMNEGEKYLVSGVCRAGPYNNKYVYVPLSMRQKFVELCAHAVREEAPEMPLSFSSVSMEFLKYWVHMADPEKGDSLNAHYYTKDSYSGSGISKMRDITLDACSRDWWDIDEGIPVFIGEFQPSERNGMPVAGKILRSIRKGGYAGGLMWNVKKDFPISENVMNDYARGMISVVRGVEMTMRDLFRDLGYISGAGVGMTKRSERASEGEKDVVGKDISSETEREPAGKTESDNGERHMSEDVFKGFKTVVILSTIIYAGIMTISHFSVYTVALIAGGSTIFMWVLRKIIRSGKFSIRRIFTSLFFIGAMIMLLALPASAGADKAGDIPEQRVGTEFVATDTLDGLNIDFGMPITDSAAGGLKVGAGVIRGNEDISALGYSPYIYAEGDYLAEGEGRVDWRTGIKWKFAPTYLVQKEIIDLAFPISASVPGAVRFPAGNKIGINVGGIVGGSYIYMDAIDSRENNTGKNYQHFMFYPPESSLGTALDVHISEKDIIAIGGVLSRDLWEMDDINGNFSYLYFSEIGAWTGYYRLDEKGMLKLEFEVHGKNTPFAFELTPQFTYYRKGKKFYTANYEWHKPGEYKLTPEAHKIKTELFLPVYNNRGKRIALNFGAKTEFGEVEPTLFAVNAGLEITIGNNNVSLNMERAVPDSIRDSYDKAGYQKPVYGNDTEWVKAAILEYGYDGFIDNVLKKRVNSIEDLLQVVTVFGGMVHEHYGENSINSEYKNFTEWMYNATQANLEGAEITMGKCSDMAGVITNLIHQIPEEKIPGITGYEVHARSGNGVSHSIAIMTSPDAMYIIDYDNVTVSHTKDIRIVIQEYVYRKGVVRPYINVNGKDGQYIGSIADTPDGRLLSGALSAQRGERSADILKEFMKPIMLKPVKPAVMSMEDRAYFDHFTKRYPSVELHALQNIADYHIPTVLNVIRGALDASDYNFEDPLTIVLNEDRSKLIISIGYGGKASNIMIKRIGKNKEMHITALMAVINDIISEENDLKGTERKEPTGGAWFKNATYMRWFAWWVEPLVSFIAGGAFNEWIKPAATLTIHGLPISIVLGALVAAAFFWGMHIFRACDKIPNMKNDALLGAELRAILFSRDVKVLTAGTFFAGILLYLQGPSAVLTIAGLIVLTLAHIIINFSATKNDGKKEVMPGLTIKQMITILLVAVLAVCGYITPSIASDSVMTPIAQQQDKYAQLYREIMTRHGIELTREEYEQLWINGEKSYNNFISIIRSDGFANFIDKLRKSDVYHIDSINGNKAFTLVAIYGQKEIQKILWSRGFSEFADKIYDNFHKNVLNSPEFYIGVYEDSWRKTEYENKNNIKTFKKAERIFKTKLKLEDIDKLRELTEMNNEGFYGSNLYLARELYQSLKRRFPGVEDVSSVPDICILMELNRDEKKEAREILLSEKAKRVYTLLVENDLMGDDFLRWEDLEHFILFVSAIDEDQVDSIAILKEYDIKEISFKYGLPLDEIKNISRIIEDAKNPEIIDFYRRLMANNPDFYYSNSGNNLENLDYLIRFYNKVNKEKREEFFLLSEMTGQKISMYPIRWIVDDRATFSIEFHKMVTETYPGTELDYLVVPLHMYSFLSKETTKEIYRVLRDVYRVEIGDVSGLQNRLGRDIDYELFLEKIKQKHLVNTFEEFKRIYGFENSDSIWIIVSIFDMSLTEEGKDKINILTSPAAEELFAFLTKIGWPLPGRIPTHLHQFNELIEVLTLKDDRGDTIGDRCREIIQVLKEKYGLSLGFEQKPDNDMYINRLPRVIDIAKDGALYNEIMSVKNQTLIQRYKKLLNINNSHDLEHFLKAIREIDEVDERLSRIEDMGTKGIDYRSQKDYLVRLLKNEGLMELYEKDNVQFKEYLNIARSVFEFEDGILLRDLLILSERLKQNNNAMDYEIELMKTEGFRLFIDFIGTDFNFTKFGWDVVSIFIRLYSEVDFESVFELKSEVEGEVYANDIFLLDVISRNPELKKLFDNKRDLLSEIESISDFEHITRSLWGMGRPPQVGYTENPDLKKLNRLALIRLYLLKNTLQKEHFLDELGKIILEDIYDETTEYGGYLSMGENGSLAIVNVESISENDSAYGNELNWYLDGGIISWHNHALSLNESVFAGPSLPDLMSARRCGRSGIVFTTAGLNEKGDKIKVNADFYYFDGIEYKVIDLGILKIPYSPIKYSNVNWKIHKEVSRIYHEPTLKETINIELRKAGYDENKLINIVMELTKDKKLKIKIELKTVIIDEHLNLERDKIKEAIKRALEPSSSQIEEDITDQYSGAGGAWLESERFPRLSRIYRHYIALAEPFIALGVGSLIDSTGLAVLAAALVFGMPHIFRGREVLFSGSVLGLTAGTSAAGYAIYTYGWTNPLVLGILGVLTLAHFVINWKTSPEQVAPKTMSWKKIGLLLGMLAVVAVSASFGTMNGIKSPTNDIGTEISSIYEEASKLTPKETPVAKSAEESGDVTAIGPRISGNKGKIKHIVVAASRRKTYDKAWARSQGIFGICSDYNKVWQEDIKNILKKFPEDTRITIMTAYDITEEVKALGLANPERINILFQKGSEGDVFYNSYTPWVQDPFVVLENERGDIVIRDVKSSRCRRGGRDYDCYDPMMGRIIAKEYGYAHIDSEAGLDFDAGNIVPVGDSYVLIRKEETLMEAVKDLGRKGITVDTPYYSHHIDLVFSDAGNNTIVVADPRMGYELFEKADKTQLKSFFERIHKAKNREGDVNKLSCSKESADNEAKVLDSMVEKLKKQYNFKVVRMPVVSVGDYLMSYNNVITSEEGADKKVYLLKYGLDSVDKGAEKVWRSLGYNVVWIESGLVPFTTGGGLRCMVKVIERKTPGMKPKILELKKSGTVPSDAVHPFRFPKYIWDHFELLLAGLGGGIYNDVKEKGIAWTDADGKCQWIYGEDSAETNSVLEKARIAINNAHGYEKVKTIAQVKEVIEYHEKIHGLLRKSKYKKLIKQFRGKLEEVIGTLHEDHSFIESFREVYGKPHDSELRTSNSELIHWYIEEFLVLSMQEKELFGKKYAVLDRMKDTAGFNDRIENVRDVIDDTLRRAFKRLFKWKRTGVMGGAGKRGKDELLANLLKRFKNNSLILEDVTYYIKALYDMEATERLPARHIRRNFRKKYAKKLKEIGIEFNLSQIGLLKEGSIRYYPFSLNGQQYAVRVFEGHDVDYLHKVGVIGNGKIDESLSYELISRDDFEKVVNIKNTPLRLLLFPVLVTSVLSAILTAIRGIRAQGEYSILENILYFLQVDFMAVYLVSMLFMFLIIANNCYFTVQISKYKDKTPVSEISYKELEAAGQLPEATIQLPVFNEANVAKRIIESAFEVDYPPEKLQIQILDDSTDETVDIVDNVVKTICGDPVEDIVSGNNHFIRYRRDNGQTVEIIRRKKRTGYKGGALSVGTRTAKEFIAIFDADFVITQDFLTRSIPYFYKKDDTGNPEPNRTCVVQGVWVYLNENESLLTKLQALGLADHMFVELTVKNRKGYFVHFHGTAGIWRKEAIEDEKVGGWQIDTVTEDGDLSYRAQLAGWKIVYLDNLQVPSELPKDIAAFKAQQARWTKGGIQVLRKILGEVWKSDMDISGKLVITQRMVVSLACFPTIFMYVFLLPLFMVADNLGIVEFWKLLYGIYFFSGYILLHFAVKVAYKRIHPEEYKENSFLTNVLYPFKLGILGIGMQGIKLKATWEALFDRESVFVRTPKDGADSDKKKKYKVGKELKIAGIEIMLGMYSLALLSMSLIKCSMALASMNVNLHVIGILVFAQAAIGFFWVGLSSIKAVFNKKSGTKKSDKTRDGPGEKIPIVDEQPAEDPEEEPVIIITPAGTSSDTDKPATDAPEKDIPPVIISKVLSPKEYASKEHNDERAILIKARQYLKGYPVNMKVDLSVIPGVGDGLTAKEAQLQLSENMKTLAGVIAWYDSFGLDIRYELVPGTDIQMVDAQKALKEELERIAQMPGIDRDRLMKCIDVPHTDSRTIEIHLLSLENMSKINTVTDRMYPVALKKSTMGEGIELPSYTGAAGIGLAIAALRVIKEEDPDMYSSEVRRFLKKISSIYERSGVETTGFNEEVLNFMVIGEGCTKLHYALRYALPPVIKIGIEKIRDYHEKMQLLLQAA